LPEPFALRLQAFVPLVLGVLAHVEPDPQGAPMAAAGADTEQSIGLQVVAGQVVMCEHDVLRSVVGGWDRAGGVPATAARGRRGVGDNGRVEKVRIDKWLWAARFFKTRTLASEAVAAGRVEIDGVKVKPSKDVQVGDTIDLRVGDTQWTVVVTGLADKRGSATVAGALYEETPASAERRQQRALERRLAPSPGADLVGRPTKRDRRLIDDLRRRGTR
jgi:ribosome-associated heat shock protein Hsp15